MKSIFESGEIMGYYAQIDCCYYTIRESQQELNKIALVSPITKAIYEATGYEKDRIKKIKILVIDLIHQIINCKKKIEADYSGDEKLLKELLKVK